MTTPRTLNTRRSAANNTPRKINSSGIAVCSGMITKADSSADETSLYRSLSMNDRVQGTIATITTTTRISSAIAAPRRSPDPICERDNPNSATVMPLTQQITTSATAAIGTTRSCTTE